MTLESNNNGVDCQAHANLSNQQSLWHCYGAIQLAERDGVSLWSNISWPYRAWIESESGDAVTDMALQTLVEALPETAIVPVYQHLPWSESWRQRVVGSGFDLQLQQVAMHLELTSAKLSLSREALAETELTLSPVAGPVALDQWVDIQNRAFGYQVDTTVIKPLLARDDIQVLLARHHGEPVAGAMLYKTGSAIGVHQLAVAPQFQGKGIARAIMLSLIEQARHWGGELMVLQASVMGRPLYESLGFCDQFALALYAEK